MPVEQQRTSDDRQHEKYPEEMDLVPGVQQDRADKRADKQGGRARWQPAAWIMDFHFNAPAGNAMANAPRKTPALPLLLDSIYRFSALATGVRRVSRYGHGASGMRSHARRR